MNVWDEMPQLPPCPHCKHAGEGINWAFPDALEQRPGNFPAVMVSCLACGGPGPAKPSYAEAIAAFTAGELERAE